MRPCSWFGVCGEVLVASADIYPRVRHDSKNGYGRRHSALGHSASRSRGDQSLPVHVPVFKVRGRTFLGMGRDQTIAVCCVTEPEADDAADPATFEAVRRREGAASWDYRSCSPMSRTIASEASSRTRGVGEAQQGPPMTSEARAPVWTTAGVCRATVSPMRMLRSSRSCLNRSLLARW
jgi:hypothetical protein